MDRNIRPHKEARLAMSFYAAEYAPSGLGCMDFWDSLHEAKKRRVREVLDALEECKRERAPDPGED